jgi:Transposase DDE domain
MVSIDDGLGAIKRDPSQLLDANRILELCREYDYWPEADGKLGPATLIGFFMRQIAAGNVSCDEVRLMGQDAFTASGYCQARMRLPLAVIQTLAREVYQKISDPIDCEDEHRWRGHRVLLIDATSFSMPDTPELKAYFGQPGQQKAGCGFPVAHLLMLFNARTGLAVDAITAPLRTHEMSLASRTHEHMVDGDLVVGDDSFGSYAHLALLARRGMHGLFPAHHVRIVDFTPGQPCIEPRKVAKAKDAKGLPRSRWVKSLGETDQIVEWFKPGQKPKWMTAAQWKQLPDTLMVREARRTISRPGFRPVTLTIVTTLLAPKKYPAAELFALRLRRWDAETDLRHLKTTMGMEILHCKTVEGVQKEMWTFMLIYNLVRGVMVAAAKRQKVAVSRISFASTLHWMRRAKDGDAVLRIAVVPHRPNRMEPRVVKRRPKEYDRMVRPRNIMQAELRAVIGSQSSG